VFDPSKVEVGGNEDASKAEDAVVGIFTERGRYCFLSCCEPKIMNIIGRL